MRPGLFQLGDFKLHSGARSRWKIECDSLSNEDLRGLARMAQEILPPFGEVEGVPTGGLRFATKLLPYGRSWQNWEEEKGDLPVLIVDDVLTTGNSMEEQRAGREAIGLVIFARGPCAQWIRPIFKMMGG